MIVSSPYATQLDRIPVRERDRLVLGARTRYWEYGEHDADTVVVMVHGFRGDHHGLEPVVSQLRLPDGLRVISPDLPGFGSSEPLADIRHDIDGYARWLRTFVAELSPGARLVVLGHSFGSIVVAAAIAGAGSDATIATPPLMPDRVVLVNPIAAPALAGPRGVMTRLAVLYYRLSARLPKRLGFALLRNRLIVRVMSVTMAKTHDRSLRRWIHDQHDRYFSAFPDRDVVLEAFTASVGSDVSDFAARIPQKTLLIAAEKDDITPVAAERRLLTLFPDATLQVIANVGHLIHYEKPAEAARHITAFLTEEAQ